MGAHAIMTFCDGLAGKAPTPWRNEEGPVNLNLSTPWFSTTYHWEDVVFNFSSGCIELYPAHNQSQLRNTGKSALLQKCIANNGSKM
jgi:hypothetical protein